MKYNNQDLINIEKQIMGCEACGGITVREYQLHILEILKEIDRICKKNDISYFLMFGTLIGAVRHHGFIPWDDDADVIMTRKSFAKFKTACEKELSNKYALISYQDNKNVGLIFHRIRKVDTAYINRFEVSKHGENAGFYVDIMVMDYLSDHPLYSRIQMRCLQALHRIVSPGFSQGVEYLPAYWDIGLNIIHFFIGRKRTIKLLEEILGSTKPEKSSKYIAQNLQSGRLDFSIFDKYHFEEKWYVPFEDTKLPIPKDAITLLNHSYYKKSLWKGTLLEAGYEDEYQAILKRNYYKWDDIMYLSGSRKRNTHMEIVFDSRNNCSIYDSHYFKRFNKKRNDKSAIKERKYRERAEKYRKVLVENETIAREVCEEIQIREILMQYQKQKDSIPVKTLIIYSKSLAKLHINNHMEFSGDELQAFAEVFIRASYLTMAKRLLNTMKKNERMGNNVTYAQLEERLQIHMNAYYAIFEKDYQQINGYLEQFTESECYLTVLLTAFLCYEYGDYMEAEKRFQSILQEDEEYFLATYYLGMIEKIKGNTDKAILYFKQSLDCTCYMPLLEMSLKELKELL